MSRSPAGRLSAFAATGLLAAAAFGAPPAAGGGTPDDGAGAGEARGEVVARAGAPLRQAPAATSPAPATAAHGERVSVLCAAEGERRSAWYLVRTDHYAWAAAGDIRVPGAAPPRC
ncbi:hypothetical protein [Streptomyces litchfieldiae]|uniref:SH3 domain-containing protein n=1 Tax=Streptomyces litchfieldiae TaxID=3075543 RepID=A0ABU2MKY0_9ACTN|nr:hypothetical protein [Streptomyces sp. DSM 44938]MDT0341573.1 hypothetical protein [Streptomyces sp. DSM 44938]